MDGSSPSAVVWAQSCECVRDRSGSRALSQRLGRQPLVGGIRDTCGSIAKGSSPGHLILGRRAHGHLRGGLAIRNCITRPATASSGCRSQSGYTADQRPNQMGGADVQAVGSSEVPSGLGSTTSAICLPRTATAWAACRLLARYGRTPTSPLPARRSKVGTPCDYPGPVEETAPI